MDKKDLLKLKEKLEQKVVMIDEVDNYKMSLYELELKKNDSKIVAESFGNYFEAVMKYYAQLGKGYDEIQLMLGFGVLFKEEDIDDREYPIEYKTGVKPIDNFVKVGVNCFYFVDEEKTFSEDPEIVYPNNCDKEFIVSFDELKSAFKEYGFILDENASLESITEKIIAQKIPVFKLSLKFSKYKKLMK